MQTQTILTERSLVLTPVQRQAIYRAITRERVTTAPPPSIDYRVNHRVVLIDPSTSEVVAEVAELRGRALDLFQCVSGRPWMLFRAGFAV